MVNNLNNDLKIWGTLDFTNQDRLIFERQKVFVLDYVYEKLRGSLLWISNDLKSSDFTW